MHEADEEAHGVAIIRQAMEQAESGTLPIEILSLLLEKLIEADNFSLAGTLYSAWRENLQPSASIPQDQQQKLAHQFSMLKAQLPDISLSRQQLH